MKKTNKGIKSTKLQINPAKLRNLTDAQLLKIVAADGKPTTYHNS